MEHEEPGSHRSGSLQACWVRPPGHNVIVTWWCVVSSASELELGRGVVRLTGWERGLVSGNWEKGH